MAEKRFDNGLETKRQEAEAIKDQITASKKGTTKMENDKKEIIKISKAKYTLMVVAVWSAAVLAAILAGVIVYYLAYHHGYDDKAADAKALSAAVESQLKTKQ